MPGIAETPLVTVPPDDLLSHVGRATGYWLVALAALVAGGYYQSESFSWNETLALFLFSVTLFPCYVIYAGVYDKAPQLRFHNPTETPRNESFTSRYLRGVSNNAWIVSAILCWFVLPSSVWALGGRWPELANAFDAIPRSRWLYCLLLLALHTYYAFWVLRRSDDVHMARVRTEVLIPVLIVAFAFFTAATVFDKQFSRVLFGPPIAVFLFFAAIHFVELWRTAKGGPGILGRAFTLPSGALILGIPVLTSALGRLVVPAPVARVWAGSLMVALFVGLYLSLFELWRLVGKVNERRDQVPALFPNDRTSKNYYDAILVSHAVAVTALPLMFLFGNLGSLFIVFATAHASAALVVWYRSGSPQIRYPDGWQWKRVAFGFVFFMVLALGVLERQLARGTGVGDWYPTNWSGVSASLFVALLFAFLATPFVQYFTESTSGATRARNFGTIIRQFFILTSKEAVFRQAAVLCGALFIAANFFYEVARSGGWSISGKASVVFWVYAAGTAMFSVLAFFFERGRGKDGSTAKDIPVSLILLGALQTLRMTTGGIVLLGVTTVGLAWGAPIALSVQLGLAVALVAMSSFALNDYYDWEKDSINAPHRAVPRGRLTPRRALFIGLATFVTGLIVGMRVIEGLGLLLFLAGAAGGALYNEFVRCFPRLKGVITAALCSLIVLFDMVAFTLPARFAWLSFACLIFVAGRELLMDVRDRGGDAAHGVRTLAVVWGDKRAVSLGFALLGVSFLPMKFFVEGSENSAAAWAIIAVYGATIGVSVGIWFLGPWTRRRWIAIESLKGAMIAAITAMIL